MSDVRLITGFTALHLQTFLQAHLQLRIPTRRLVVSTDIYGDVLGALTRIQTASPEMCAIALEWPDLDPRLGFRRLGGWGHKELADIVGDAETKVVAIRESLAKLPDRLPVALSLPTLPLPPVFHTPSWQLCEGEIRLRRAVNELALWGSGRANIKLMREAVARESFFREARETCSDQGFDFKGELVAGLPYTIAHADQLAQSFAQLLAPPTSKKGLITDLDETLWAGIAGEIGPAAVSWDLDNKTQTHGLYQQLLRALADQGVLIGVASKNDSETVDAVFQRTDIVLPRDRLFPVEVHWNPKSESVSRILDAWNISADSVVFVDDSASELAEVKAAHPGIECIRFDGQDYDAVLQLLHRLRDLFARKTVTEEDGLRRESLRAGAVFRQTAQETGASPEDFLREAEAKVTFGFSAVGHPRSLELVNKTNQFNLNGTRYSEAEWLTCFEASNAFVISASYRDKYGPLGAIAVLAGQSSDAAVTLASWVMSCRAFGRRIEYQCLKAILDRFPNREIIIEFSATPRNEYLQKFFESLLGERPAGPFRISRARFLERCPKLYHEIETPEIETHE